MPRIATSKDRVFKTLLVLGACLLVAQVFIASNYDIRQLQFRDFNSTRRLVRQLHLFSNDTYNFNKGTKLTLLSNETITASKLQLSVFQNVSQTNRSEGHHEGHDGFALAASVREVCKSVKDRSIGRFFGMQGSVAKRLLYCPMEKVGTTFWRRVLYMLNAKDAAKYKNPYDVPIQTALKANRLYDIPSRTYLSSLLKSNSFTFLVVRNPFSRLLSAFVDKLVPPNPYYWKAFGSKAILAYRKNATSRSKLYGHDVTFSEFVKHVVASEKTKKNLDVHYISTFSSCKPCETNYNYIGKMETFKDDAMFILNKTGMNSSVKILSEPDKFKDLTIDDAITDSIYSPFGWRKTVIPIISWDKALRRVWLKLQMRGIISVTETFDSHVSASDIAKNISADDFIEKARTAHVLSKPEDLKQQKLEVMREAFMTLHIDDLNAFRKAYKFDFSLFGYDDNPSLLFERPREPQVPTKYFNYNHLN